MTLKNKAKSADLKFIQYEHLDNIGEISVYYGFVPMKSPNITKQDLEAAKGILDGDYVDDETDRHGTLPLHAEEKIAVMRMYQENDLQSLSQPIMIYFKNACRGSIKKSGYHRYADLEILGASGAIAEATLIQTARAMLVEQGYKSTAVEINSIGDRDSISRFNRELTAYYRKNINSMTPECRQLMKQDVFELLSSHDDEAREINEKAPRSMDFLSETSKHHLEETLEYLEALKIPYTINNSLIGNRKYCNETIFTITNTDTADKKTKQQRVLAVGVRYNNLAKRLGMKRDVPGIGISLLTPDDDPRLRKSTKKMRRPLASFIQLGLESKLISLDIVERLRQVKIPLYLSLAKDRLGAQVSSIEKYHTPYMIVMGKKEAVEHTVIVRKTETHAQEIVTFDNLAKHMKKIVSN